MKKLLTICLLIATTIYVNAQNGSIPFAKIQKLLDKTVGIKKVNLILGSEEKITKQLITETSYSLYFTGLGKYKSKWIWECSEIPWDNGFIYFSGNSGSEKLTRCVFQFKTIMKKTQKTEDRPDIYDVSSNEVEFYILKKDIIELENLINRKQ